MQKNCKNCGASNLEQARFCAECGGALNIDISPNDNIKERTPAQQATEAAEKARIKAGIFAAKTKHIWSNLTRGEKIMVVGAFVAFIAFFLPWISVSGKYVNGPKIGSETWYVYLLPLSMLVSVALIYFTQGATTNCKVLIASWQIVIGALWSSISLLLVIAVRTIINAMQEVMGGFGAFLGAGSPSANTGVGIYLVIAGSIAIVVGAFKLQSGLLRDNKEKE